MNVLGIDIGDRYIGVAATDHSDAIAYRYATIDRKSQDALQELQNIVKKESIERIIAGVPYHVEDGSETKQTLKTKQFIIDLRALLGDSVGVLEMDETLTSKEAKQTLSIEGADVSQEHAEAARLILQDFLIHGTY
jgi:putative Holliday junction resolvase